MQKKVHITTKLDERQGFAWFGNDQCRVRGSFFDSRGKVYSGSAMSDYFGAGQTYEAFCDLVAGANGIFSVISIQENACWLATDLVRSLPLFYCRVNSGWVISDHAGLLQEQLGKIEINTLSQMEFQGTGYVTGRETLVQGICQVQAGEVVRLDNKEDHYFHHTYRTSVDFDAGSAQEKLAEAKLAAREVMERAFTRMVSSLEGKTAVIPLSGGFDSRLIAVLLKKHGYKDVVCFTYGRKGNEEAAISEKVAQALGFPWHFVEYDTQLVADFVHTPEFAQYHAWASNFTSMFFLQEYFAVKYLYDHALIPEDAVFIPGHSGDFLGGSQFAKHQLPVRDESERALAARILEVKYHFERYSRPERNVLLDRILEQLRAKGNGNARSWSVHEDWDLKEKLAKFNVNSTSTYTFFGYTFRLPYYDRELIDFFRDLPVDLKRDKSLYDDLLIHSYFIPEGVHFDVELQTPDRAYARARFRQRIKRFLPRWILALRPQRADALCYREITAQLRRDLLQRGGRPAAYGSKYNKMIIDWYLSVLQEKFSNRF